MFTWPKLELTDWERKYVRPYAQEVRLANGQLGRLPGVLRRVYPLLTTNDTTLGEPSNRIQISRRSRVFGLTFSGDISYTRLQITNASGTLYTVGDPRTNVQPFVSAMCSGSIYMFGSNNGGLPDFGNVTAVGDDVQLAVNEQTAPLLIEPNWILQPNETLIFNAEFDVDSGTAVRVLNIAVHVWEFPGMSVADKSTAEAL